ncbi:MAG: hypothetical protein BGO92_17360 [Magnetospirillum sp. 64-120]|nr:MAG: hypothetical protein BGO92_17360 [Magnetospirillum sp. 64-120]
MDDTRIPIMRPFLPDTETLIPYLRRIDNNRWYSNYGPLCHELEERLAEHWSVKTTHVLSLSNATQALSIALWSVEAPAGSLCLMPSWSFVATAHAARQVGFTPFLTDVDANSAALTPDIAFASLKRAPSPVGAVIVVCPFGAPVPWEDWADFQQRTGIPVIIDAAAAFDTVQPGPVPTVVSLHATKVFPAGEGAILMCTNDDVVEQARRRANFGFLGDHHSRCHATNAKMSEYHAAVGLASLDAWPANRRRWQSALNQMRQACAQAGLADWPQGLGETYVCSSPTIRSAAASHLISGLQSDGIEARRWWQGGIASHEAFNQVPRLALPVTEQLAATTLALPCWLDIDPQSISRVAASLKRHAHPD